MSKKYLFKAKYASNTITHMGSTASVTVPTKPKDYPQEKWQKALSWFDHVDSNSNFVIDDQDKELTTLARTIVTAEANRLRKTKDLSEQELKSIEDEKRKKFEAELSAWRATYEAGLRRLDAKIEYHEAMTDSQTREFFIEECGGGKITFDKFFTYIKDKL